MLDNFKIYIPTLGRVNNQITLEFLTSRVPELIDKITLLVSQDEHDRYYEKWGFWYCDVIAVPDDLGKGIHIARQFALDYHLEKYGNTVKHAIMIDDDMVFARRGFLGKKLFECTRSDLIDMLEMIVGWLESGIPLVGVSARQGNNHHESDFSEAARQMNFHAVDVLALEATGIRFDEFEVMEDFNVTLSLLSLGIANRVSYEFCWNQKGSGADGGCSAYRDAALQAKAAEALHAKFPDFVTVVEKQSKTVWKGMETRKDVRIQWKKAYEQGLSDNLIVK